MYKAQATIGGITNTVNTVSAAAETAKGIGNLLKFGKGKNKKEAMQANTPVTQSVTNDSATKTAVTTVIFNKIDYLKMKQMKDELVKLKQIKDVKVNYNTDGKNFFLIQHNTDTDEILTAILTKWGNRYEVVSTSADAVVFKEK